MHQASRTSVQNELLVERSRQVFLGLEVIVGHFQARLARPRQHFHVAQNGLRLAVACFVKFRKIGKLVGLADHFFARLDERVGREAAHFFLHDLPFGVQKKERRVGRDHVFVGKAGAVLVLFHVFFQTDKVFVEKRAHFRVGENLRGHPFAGPAPARETVHEDEFFLGLGLAEGLVERAVEKFDALCGGL